MPTTHYHAHHPRTNTHPSTHGYHTPKHKHPPIHPSTPHLHARYTAADAPTPMTTTHPHTNTQPSTHAYHPPTMPSTRAQTPCLPPKHQHLPLHASTYLPTHPSTHPPTPTHARAHTGYMAEDGPTCVLECGRSVLECVEVCWSVLQSVAVGCSVLQCVAVHSRRRTHTNT